ncbi:MAG: hypothetical protein BKP49_08875 [Treponema sp. CETP13]|nr:MAG: hypothetical protein BKP49_08875 [Treponema sp. CETP13]
MQQKNFVVIGNTVRTTKYATKIKNGLLEKGYNVAGVGSELKSLNDVPFDIDIIDLCINAKEGLRLLQENTKSFKCIVIQPGAESEELINWLNEKKINYIEGCLLVGLSLYT